MKRAILEIIASGMATTMTDLEAFCGCTLLASEKRIEFKFVDLQAIGGYDTRSEEQGQDSDADPIGSCLRFLLHYEFIRLQMNEDTKENNLIATKLGKACLGKYINNILIDHKRDILKIAFDRLKYITNFL